MSFYYPPFNDSLEPNQGNVRAWLDNLSGRLQPIEQARWNQSNIDTLFYAGSQDFINRYFNTSRHSSSNNFYFNLCQQPVNMVTGYQRQHRKQINYIPGEGADTDTTDQYTSLMTHICNANGIHEKFSRACEQAAITGMVLLQPYLDFTSSDQAQGDLQLKLWEYNSFMVDPFAREMDLSDANVVWTQEYISVTEAKERFPDKYNDNIQPTSPGQRTGSFYFLPESNNAARNNLMVLSYVWYKAKRKKQRLYSPSKNQFFDFAGGQEQLDQILYAIPDMQKVEVDVPTWKLSVVLNDQLMYQGENPLGFDTCPFIPVVWNYEPHNNMPDLRVRGLIRTMRDSNYLMNRRIIINHDIAESTINQGWIRKIGAVANEDNLKKTGQGWDIIVNEGYELSDIQKIMPSSVPPSDLALAEQLQSLIFSTSGVNLESWSAENSPNASTLTVLMKQAANLMVLQKYFDQWDLSLKLLGALMLDIVLNNWSAEKVKLIIGEEPTPYFYSKIFCKYQTVVEEGILTPTQKYQEYQSWLELNQQLGGIIPPQEIAKRAPIQGKTDLLKILQQQHEQQAAMQGEMSSVQHAFEHAKLQELQSKAANNIAMAKERYGRFESNVGLLEERMSEVSKNRALSTKAKMEALEKMVDVTAKLGAIETMVKFSDINQLDQSQSITEDIEKQRANSESLSHEFANKILNGVMMPQQQNQPQGVEQDLQQQQI